MVEARGAGGMRIPHRRGLKNHQKAALNAESSSEKQRKEKGSKVYYVTDTQSEQKNGSKPTFKTLFQKKVPFVA
jgi:hypothetical protein